MHRAPAVESTALLSHWNDFCSATGNAVVGAHPGARARNHIRPSAAGLFDERSTIIIVVRKEARGPLSE
jgi:hypothetical protein